MNVVYVVITEDREIQGVFRDKNSASTKVKAIAKQRYGITPKDTPLDFNGALTIYGWINTVWWVRKVLY